MAAKKQEKSLEASLWDACNKLRGKVEASEYKHVMLSLIFLKYANDRFEIQRKKMIDEGKEKFLEMLPFYTKDNVFFIPECARWDYLMSQSKQDDIAIIVDTALSEIENKNNSLKGALPDNYFSRLDLARGVLGGLLDLLNDINLSKEDDKDVFGRIYEYFLSQFAIKEGKGKGEFFTPQTVVALLCELIEPYEGIVYDGAMGSGGMFVQSMKFIENHKGNTKKISVYGQEYTSTTRKLALMNLAIRGISANVGERAADTFGDDQHKDLKADYALMNPPFNQKDWRLEGELLDDPRWKGYQVPPTSNANYAWMLNMVSKLSDNGTGCLLISNGALTADSDEYEIRKQLLENDLIESIIILPMKMFYSTDISVSIIVFNKNKMDHIVEKNNKKIHFRNRKNEVLFLDLRKMGHPFQKKYIELTKDERTKISNTFHNWQYVDGNYNNIKEYCYSAKIDEIREKDYSLAASRYIELDQQEESIDINALSQLNNELLKLFDEEEKSKKELLKILGAINNEIK